MRPPFLFGGPTAVFVRVFFPRDQEGKPSRSLRGLEAPRWADGFSDEDKRKPLSFNSDCLSGAEGPRKHRPNKMAFSTLNPKRPPIPQRSYVFRSNRFGARRVDFALCFEFSIHRDFLTPLPQTSQRSQSRGVTGATHARQTVRATHRRAHDGERREDARRTGERTISLLIKAAAHARTRTRASPPKRSQEPRRRKKNGRLVPSCHRKDNPANPTTPGAARAAPAKHAVRSRRGRAIARVRFASFVVLTSFHRARVLQQLLLFQEE